LVTQRIAATGSKDAGSVLLWVTFAGQPRHAGWPTTRGGPVVVVGTGAALADADAGGLALAAPVPDAPPVAAGVLVLAVAQPVASAARAATAAIRVASCIM
jgi:hypothetical protein